MQRPVLLAIFACVAAASASGARGADAAPPVAPPVGVEAAATLPAPPLVEGPQADRPKGGEPAIRRTVIEDRQARIEELRVRGNLQKVTVAPKGRAPGYEVLTGDGFHATAEDPGTSRGSAGKRVWNVLRF